MAESFLLHDITDLDGCRAVVEVQRQVWGAGSEIVPASVLLVSAKRGGILIGATGPSGLAGFVWSLPGWRDGQPTHWSHMLAVVDSARGQGLGERLKLAQRERALGQGIGLIEWTFDPLQAANAHLNLARLGAIARTYLPNVYGQMQGDLHRGTPTDRLVAEWMLDSHAGGRDTGGGTAAIITRTDGSRDVPARTELDLPSPRLIVPVPGKFTELQRASPETALAWRLAVRDVFTTYFARGYQAVGFRLDRETGGGDYVLAKF
jgi:predicted GNAT superfamily acetyltransferase